MDNEEIRTILERKVKAVTLRPSVGQNTARTTVRLTPNGEGTEVGVDLEAEGAGLLGSMLFPVIAAAIGNGFTGTVEDFVSGL